MIIGEFWEVGKRDIVVAMSLLVLVKKVDAV
jgi:hypothetical protein